MAGSNKNGGGKRHTLHSVYSGSHKRLADFYDSRWNACLFLAAYAIATGDEDAALKEEKVTEEEEK